MSKKWEVDTIILLSNIGGWAKFSICMLITILLSFATNKFVEQKLFHN